MVEGGFGAGKELAGVAVARGIDISYEVSFCGFGGSGLVVEDWEDLRELTRVYEPRRPTWRSIRFGHSGRLLDRSSWLLRYRYRGMLEWLVLV